MPDKWGLPRSFGFMIDGTLLFRSIKNGFR